ncbi:MAG: 3-isopropylmalate dehydratase large subunit [Lachnospiraceae bacterium]|nr:3-isopropylmalate dehydratase large subunit [Lachnospiraceae bacterium]
MSSTITKKIFERHVGKEVHDDELVFANVDRGMGTDATIPLAIQEFEKIGCEIFSKEKLVIIQDHFVPAKDIATANYSKIVRDFSVKNSIKNYFEVGKGGICHHVMMEYGLCKPGDLVVGADSHTCTYGAAGLFATGIGSTDLAAFMATGKLWFRIPKSIKVIFEGTKKRFVQGKDIILELIGEIGVSGASYRALEFVDNTTDKLTMSDRITICNMAIECGAKTGIFEYDEVTEDFYCDLGIEIEKERKLKVGDDKEYEKVISINLDEIEPKVAMPFLPSNIKSVKDVGDIEIHQAFIGSCTNGRIEDMRMAAEVLKGNTVNKNVRLIVIPGTQNVLSAMAKEGLLEIFIQAGASVTSPTCGPCLGGHYGILANGEICISTSNRNFVGRMGDKTSMVYLANPAVVAASAVEGKICLPKEVI